MNSFRLTVLACALAGGLLGSEANAVSIETVPVGNPGNAGELSGIGAGGYGENRICGSVSYEYRIGKYEVTAGQYSDFLNAVAATDTHGLYNLAMSYQWGCKIERTGSEGRYRYSVAPDWANRPVNYVSWGDAARFVNWLHNGQPTGEQDLTTTEDGAYFLNGAIGQLDLPSAIRKPTARWAIPSEDEWYKAAYHKNDGVTGNYWDYPTGSNNPPSNLPSDPSEAARSATYYDHDGTGTGGYTIGSPYYFTEVGAHQESASPYGTFDQGGNAWEWNETVFYGYLRDARGGAFNNGIRTLQASGRTGDNSTSTREDATFGFRIVQLPEPATIALLSLGCFAALRRRGR